MFNQLSSLQNELAYRKATSIVHENPTLATILVRVKIVKKHGVSDAVAQSRFCDERAVLTKLM